MTNEEWQVVNTLVAHLHMNPPIVDLVEAYFKKWNNRAPARNLVEAIKEVQELLDQPVTDSPPPTLPSESVVTLPHEFDSSRTCNYCGIDQARALGRENICKRRMEGRSRMSPKSQTKVDIMVLTERKVTAFRVYQANPTTETKKAFLAAADEFNRVIKGT